MKTAFLVLESGECFSGEWKAGAPRAGEVVFNTSHSGYEEMATDPSYYNQILVTTAPMQGNYGESDEFWESEQISINGFVCLELQQSQRDSTWLNKLARHEIPILTDIDTRKLVLHLREQGTTWGALVAADNQELAKVEAQELIAKAKTQDLDWAFAVSCKEPKIISGDVPAGPKVAVIDFGCKKNILRELKKRCSEVKLFPSRVSAEEVKAYAPAGIMLSNGPGNPEDVMQATETVKELIGWRQIFGICMGHQILSRALGAKTYKLKFGHRGSNHPIRDEILNQIYVTSQNHGYAVDVDTLPKDIVVTHVNLNDQTVSGIQSLEKKLFSVQFHPESHPGPHDAESLFDYFIKQIQ